MGEHEIHSRTEDEDLRSFMRSLLEDVRALERMIEEGRFETGVRRIGAEQEMFLVDHAMRPANRAPQLLEKLDPAFFTVELGQFNLECNLSPQTLEGDCLSRMEQELTDLVDRAQEVAEAEGTTILLTGILPTLEKDDLTLESMTPSPRFHRINEALSELRGGEFRTLIKGLDELQTTHDNVMLEACNTSFQVHFQVEPREFAKLYNLAQIVAGPVLAAAVNSPVLLRHRLWHETRVALFQQSLDTRSETHTQRGRRTRVSFGERWIEDSVLEIFREDIARFRVLLSTELEESPLDVLDRGEVPGLGALRLHNGTVYRWNRPCYGISNGKPHLRIENRILPAGPTIRDEIANAAFFYGLMCALGEEYEDVTTILPFDDAKENFLAAARYGLNARMRWTGGTAIGANDLILDHLLEVSREGLLAHGIFSADADRYSEVLRRRVDCGRTGAQWMLDSITALGDRVGPDERCRVITASMAKQQAGGKPVAEWELARFTEPEDVRESYRRVGQMMQTDLFTAHPEDLIDLAASVMDWEHIRHVPVEDQEGRLVGLVSHRQLLRMVGRGAGEGAKPVAVREIMMPDPVTVSPETSTLDAIALMRKHKVGCLPVVRDDKLIGIVTEFDFIDLAAQLLDRWLREE